MIQNQTQFFRAGLIGRMPLPCNDNSESCSYCPRCKKMTTAPITSAYLGGRSMEYRWSCAACDHDWITTSLAT